MMIEFRPTSLNFPNLIPELTIPVSCSRTGLFSSITLSNSSSFCGRNDTLPVGWSSEALKCCLPSTSRSLRPTLDVPLGNKRIESGSQKRQFWMKRAVSKPVDVETGGDSGKTGGLIEWSCSKTSCPNRSSSQAAVLKQHFHAIST